MSCDSRWPVFSDMRVVDPLGSDFVYTFIRSAFPAQTHKGYARGYWHSSETKTTAFSPHYAEVMLAAPAAVGLVRIWNRVDCCDDRINGAVVRGRDEAGELHPCGGPAVTAGKGAAVDVSCDNADSSSGPAPLIVAIRVELHTDVPLQIVELEAFPARRAAAAAAGPSWTKPAAADAAADAAGAGSEDVDEDFSWEDDDADGGAASCAAGVRGWSPLAVEAWLRSKGFDAMAAKCAAVGSVDGTQLLALAADAAALVAGGYGVDTRLHQRRLRLEVESAVKQSSGGCATDD